MTVRNGRQCRSEVLLRMSHMVYAIQLTYVKGIKRLGVRQSIHWKTSCPQCSVDSSAIQNIHHPSVLNHRCILLCWPCVLASGIDRVAGKPFDGGIPGGPNQTGPGMRSQCASYGDFKFDERVIYFALQRFSLKNYLATLRLIFLIWTFTQQEKLKLIIFKIHFLVQKEKNLCYSAWQIKCYIKHQ